MKYNIEINVLMKPYLNVLILNFNYLHANTHFKGLH